MKYVEIRANDRCPLGLKIVSIIENYENLCHEGCDLDDLATMACFAVLRDFLENNFVVGTKHWAQFVAGRAFGLDHWSEDRLDKNLQMISSVVVHQDSSVIERIKRANDLLWTAVKLAIHITRVDCDFNCPHGNIFLNFYKKFDS